MAEIKKYLDLPGLGIYDAKLKEKMASDIAAAVEEATYDDTALSGRVTTVEKNINTLNGTGEGSVSKKVADAVAAIIADAPEAYDTLKEISDWITSHSDSASAMNSAITANTEDIAELVALVGSLPEDAGVTTIIEYIDSKVGDIDFTDAINAAKSEAISTAAADATSKADNALTNAKAYADGLAVNYATAEQGSKADTAVQEIVTGATNGTISVDDVEVKVFGLGDAAYTDPSAYDAAGTADTKVNALAEGAVATNTAEISTLKTKVETLESQQISAITEEEINALFATVD